ncbi:MAG: Arc family DNA-binding protein [Chloroflexi bacterium]|nr:Arc family DNA-binding protein [Chloroflexota bacterium]
MPRILVRDVSQPVLDTLKERARRNRRSLQREVLEILEASARESTTQTPAQVAAAIRARLTASRRTFSDSADLIREDRER